MSDAYAKTEERPKLELVVDVLNINYGMNREIMERCKMLSDYAKYVDRVRKYDTILPTEEAVERAIKECIDEDILAELLTRHRKEVVQMSIFEFDAEKEWKLIREDEREIGYEEGRAAGREEGKAEGRAEGRAEGEKLGEVRLARFAALSEKLLNEGRTQELLKATQDEKYRKKLYEEYRL